MPARPRQRAGSPSGGLLLTVSGLRWTGINTESRHRRLMKQMYLPLKFTMAFKAAPRRPGLKINITLMTPGNCSLNSSDKPAEWTEALNSVSLSLQWQLLCRDWKTCFSLSFSRKPFYPSVFTRFFLAWTSVTQSFLPSGLNWWQCRS